MTNKNRWVLASNNQHKLEEIQDQFPTNIELISLKEIGFSEEIVEDADTFKGNALIKAKRLYEYSGLPSLADDSGLCVKALNYGPGVHSARYANTVGPVNHSLNNKKLLNELYEVSDRSGYFITVLCLVGLTNEPLYFEGKVHGTIGRKEMGEDGFGYDPLFIPDGYSKTFAELGSGIKNKLSHRSNALKELKNYFQWV